MNKIFSIIGAGIILLISIILVIGILALEFGIFGLVFWGIGSFVSWAFGLCFKWTFWHGVAVALIAWAIQKIFKRSNE